MVGNTVGFASGRDQWMSEGFADMSASLYISMIEKNLKKFLQFWSEERKTLLQRNAHGFRAIDAGPVTLGYRTNNSRTGNDVAQDLIYPKGAYILHMIRMMMWDARTGDQTFRVTMHDFVQTYSGRAASTEDFKAVVEKHMTPEMDLDGNRRLDWFFNEYVYGTALPAYKFDSTFGKNGDGDAVFNMKMTQSGVENDFKMLIPIYLELSGGASSPRTRPSHRKLLGRAEHSAQGLERHSEASLHQLQLRCAGCGVIARGDGPNENA